MKMEEIFRILEETKIKLKFLVEDTEILELFTNNREININILNMDEFIEFIRRIKQ